VSLFLCFIFVRVFVCIEVYFSSYPVDLLSFSPSLRPSLPLSLSLSLSSPLSTSSLTLPPSGFTTSLQLRETPVFLKTDSTKETISTREEGTDRTSAVAVPIPLHQVEAGDKNFKYVLQPRQKLNFGTFMLSRLVGLLPILWLGMLLNMGSWLNATNSSQPMSVQVLYCSLETVDRRV
jgi:hypothetical protein